MSIYHIGICGLGHMGKGYLRNLLKCGIKSQLVVFDTDANVLKDVREEVGMQNIFFTNDLDIFFSKIPSGSRMIITAPTHTHFFYLRKSLDLQFNVLCEKPMGNTSQRISYLHEFQNKGLILQISFPERYFSKRADFFEESAPTIYINSKRTSFYRGQNVDPFSMVQDLIVHDLDHVLELLKGVGMVKNINTIVENFSKEKKTLCLKLILELADKKSIEWLWKASYQNDKERVFSWKDQHGVSRNISFITSENLLQKQVMDFLQNCDRGLFLDMEYEKNVALYSIFEKILEKINY